jgi:ATP-binding cassette subfamily F protein uup
MSILISANQISKNVGSTTLFEELSLGIFEKEKIGLIGPNGAGKSTLLKMLAGTDKPDDGEISRKKNLSFAYVPQTENFPEDRIVSEYMTEVLKKDLRIPDIEAEVQTAIYLSLSGFEDTEVKIETLSGGWRKRLAISIALAKEPELLMLDEPTNHMDWEGVLWLESYLKSYEKAFILISHDRAMLQNTTKRTIEINRAYLGGFLSLDLNYSDFLIKKEEHIEQQLKLQSSMQNKARRETEWLRAGVKARTTKSSARIKEANQLIEDTKSLNTRNQAATAKVRLTVQDSKRKTKKLLDFKEVSIGYPTNTLAEDLDFALGPKHCLGLLGQNGSGKTTFLKTIQGELEALSGTIKKADDLKIVYFEQKRSDLPMDKNLVDYLGEGSDYVVFQDQSVHVASYASKFLFSSERLRLQISRLSGGEQARLLIAKILLQPADVLIMDEPTNDLDIDTIDVLEDLLLSFQGLSILVSHDRFFLKALCDRYLAFEGDKTHNFYADLDQWLKHTFNKKKSSPKEVSAPQEQKAKFKPKVKLSYKDKEFLKDAEAIIMKEEVLLETLNSKLASASQSGNSNEVQSVAKEVSALQTKIEGLYARWEELGGA